MKQFLKYGLMLSLAGLYLWFGITLSYSSMPDIIVPIERTGHGRTSLQPALFIGDALPVSTVYEVNTIRPLFRYLSRDTYATLQQEHQREISPYYRHINTTFLYSFALKQDIGYYIYGLRKIIV